MLVEGVWDVPDEYLDLPLDYLEELPTLCEGQADDLKIDDGDCRIWLCRCGVGDGMPFDNAVTIEMKLISGGWHDVYIYEAV